MRLSNTRTIKLKKSRLIDKIKQNKKNHIELYNKAVIAYKKEALKQIEHITELINKGEVGVKLDLVTPVNKEEEYDKIIEMFDWEVEEVIELNQNEFREYVQDEIAFATDAKFRNMTYASSH